MEKDAAQVLKKKLQRLLNRHTIFAKNIAADSGKSFIDERELDKIALLRTEKAIFELLGLENE